MLDLQFMDLMVATTVCTAPRQFFWLSLVTTSSWCESTQLLGRLPTMTNHDLLDELPPLNWKKACEKSLKLAA
jgi:hypothetical protein